jgi:hypothetical protein
MPLHVLNGPTIDAGAAESNVLALGDDFIVGLIAPEGWTPAIVTVICSPNGDNYYDLYDGTGGEFTFNVVPGTIIHIDPDKLLLASFIRFRSGTRDQPIVQPVVRRFYCIGAQRVALLAGESPARRGLPDG